MKNVIMVTVKVEGLNDETWSDPWLFLFDDADAAKAFCDKTRDYLAQKHPGADVEIWSMPHVPVLSDADAAFAEMIYEHPYNFDGDSDSDPDAILAALNAAFDTEADERTIQ